MRSLKISGKLRLLAKVLLFLLLCAIILVITSGLISGLPSQWSGVAIGIITSLCTFGLTVLFLRWNRLKLSDVGEAVSSRSPFRLAVGLVCGFVLVALHLCLLLSAGHVSLVCVNGISAASIGTALLMYLALACREELAFHGYALRRLEQPLGLWIAQFLIAFIFAAEHVVGGVTWIHAFSGAAIGSLLFGMAALATRGLAVPIGMHAGWNFGEWVLGGKDSPGLWKQVAEPGFGSRLELTVSLSYIAVFLFATAAFWVLYRKRKHSNTSEAMQISAAG
ncbi:MAG TPA: type II CAAX endopeptidase family protein [Bryocella sp.]|nr:type II CAAX endopeptidase family protein [Bryocella sp.]